MFGLLLAQDTSHTNYLTYHRSGKFRRYNFVASCLGGENFLSARLIIATWPYSKN